MDTVDANVSIPVLAWPGEIHIPTDLDKINNITSSYWMSEMAAYPFQNMDLIQEDVTLIKNNLNSNPSLFEDLWDLFLSFCVTFIIFFSIVAIIKVALSRCKSSLLLILILSGSIVYYFVCLLDVGTVHLFSMDNISVSFSVSSCLMPDKHMLAILANNFFVFLLNFKSIRTTVRNATRRKLIQNITLVLFLGTCVVFFFAKKYFTMMERVRSSPFVMDRDPQVHEGFRTCEQSVPMALFFWELGLLYLPSFAVFVFLSMSSKRNDSDHFDFRCLDRKSGEPCDLCDCMEYTWFIVLHMFWVLSLVVRPIVFLINFLWEESYKDFVPVYTLFLFHSVVFVHVMCSSWTRLRSKKDNDALTLPHNLDEKSASYSQEVSRLPEIYIVPSPELKSYCI